MSTTKGTPSTEGGCLYILIIMIYNNIGNNKVIYW